MSIQADRILGVRTTRTVYLDGDTVIKLYDAQQPKSEVLSEALRHAAAEETGLNVPKLLEVREIDGRWAMIYEFVRGKTLGQLIFEHPEKTEEFLGLFVTLQLEVHEKEASRLSNLYEGQRRDIGASGLSAILISKLLALLDALPRRERLCHGDFDPANIVVDRSGTPYVLDWASASRGEPLADAARTSLLFTRSGAAGLAEKYRALYCEKSGAAPQRVEKWLPIIAASGLVQGRPEDRELLMSWLVGLTENQREG